MNNLQLEEHIDEEFISNPFLIKKRFCDNHCDFLEELPAGYNLQDEIFKEASFLRLDESEKDVVATLVNNVDGGFLSGDLLKYVAEEKGIGYFDLLKIVRKLKKTSFAHLFAFNLQDKLKTFLENEKIYNNDYRNLVENINLALSGNWSAFRSRCGDCDLAEMTAKMRNAFTSACDLREDANLYRSIDIRVEKESLDEFRTTLEESTAVEIEFDRELHAQSVKKQRSRAEKSYIQNNALSAKLLVRAAHSRSSALLKIASEIVDRQRDFFAGRDAYLTPVSVKTVACSMFLHESAVYRAISNKTVSTPRGIFELKSLFPREIKSRENKVGDCCLKECMEKLIRNEPKNSPYSDGHIADFLNAQGIVISRRSISKYRNCLSIPTASERKRHFAKISPNLGF